MRWLSGRTTRLDSSAVEPFDRIDPVTLEVVEVDGDGRLIGPPAAQRNARVHEIEYAARDRDPTSLAGVWEALTRS